MRLCNRIVSAVQLVTDRAVHSFAITSHSLTRHARMLYTTMALELCISTFSTRCVQIYRGLVMVQSWRLTWVCCLATHQLLFKLWAVPRQTISAFGILTFQVVPQRSDSLSITPRAYRSDCSHLTMSTHSWIRVPTSSTILQLTPICLLS